MRFTFPTREICRSVSGFVTDCPSMLSFVRVCHRSILPISFLVAPKALSKYVFIRTSEKPEAQNKAKQSRGHMLSAIAHNTCPWFCFALFLAPCPCLLNSFSPCVYVSYCMVSVKWMGSAATEIWLQNMRSQHQSGADTAIQLVWR